jgi:hypothetical protein
MLVLLPVILIPLLTLGFYALGGGRGGQGVKGIALTKGLNMRLPEAKFDAKKKGMSKLGFYQQSDQDSIRLRERRKQDPYYGWKDSAAGLVISGSGYGESGLPGRPAARGWSPSAPAADMQAAELLRKLDRLKGVLSSREQAGIPEAPLAARGATQPGYMSAHVSGGQPIASAMPPVASSLPFSGAGRSAMGDPDLDKLNTLMDKVLKVRSAGEAFLRDSTPAVRADRPVQVLSAPEREEVMTTVVEADGDGLETGFIDLDEEARSDSLAERMIAAVVDGAQTLISGEEVMFRTAEVAKLGGVTVPKGTVLSGKATLSGERLLVTVNAVRIGSRVMPVSIDVLDMDGITGIRVKGSLNRDVSKESASEAVGALGVTSLDPGVAGQATAAGILAAKNLLSRKIRLVRLGLPAGYRVLLRNKGVNR